MILFLFFPLGLFSLVLAVICLRAGKIPHSLLCTLTGLVFLGVASLMSYGTTLLIAEISRTS